VNDELTAAVGALTAVMLPAGTLIARSWPVPARHRGPRRVAELLADAELVPLDELLTAEAEFTAEYGDTAPVWRYCPGHDTPASDGWWCPACHLPIPTHTTTITTGNRS
jgi:hypothetical protein